MVVLNALDAAERGAIINTRTRCESARRINDLWQIDYINTITGKRHQIKARSIINAAGPWVNRIIKQAESVDSQRHVRLVKGSHIVVPKFWEGNQAYLVQNTDKRVIFINPYENGRALIGTTDIAFDGDADDVCIDESEIDYLLTAVNRYFKKALMRSDILHTFAGVRPLFDDNADNPSAVTRDYLFDLDTDTGKAPMLSIFGGKITTFRKLAEHALDKMQPFFPHMSAPWTSLVPLPGGDIDNADFDEFVARLKNQYSQLPETLLLHYARLYGTRCQQLLSGVQQVSDLGKQFSEHCFEIEARFLIKYEWAHTSEDILRRRTKHALHMSDDEVADFKHWLQTSQNKQSDLQSIYGHVS